MGVTCLYHALAAPALQSWTCLSKQSMVMSEAVAFTTQKAWQVAASLRLTLSKERACILDVRYIICVAKAAVAAIFLCGVNAAFLDRFSFLSPVTV